MRLKRQSRKDIVFGWYIATAKYLRLDIYDLARLFVAKEIEGGGGGG